MEKHDRENYLKGLNSNLQVYLAIHGIPSIRPLKNPQFFSRLSLRAGPASSTGWVNIDVAEIDNTVSKQKLSYVSSTVYFPQNPGRITRNACSIAKSLFFACSDFFQGKGYKLQRIEFAIAIHQKSGSVIYQKWPSVYTAVLTGIDSNQTLSLEEIAEYEYQKQLKKELEAAGAFAYWTGNSN